jgi:predicted enzyme related to lactoylglutathione lyase
MRLTHVRLNVPADDFEECFRFYRDVLGFETEWPCEPPYSEFEAGGVRLGLFDRGIMSELIGAPMPGGDGSVLLCVEVEDVDEAYRRVLAGGGSPVREPQDQPVWRLRVALVRDPAGNVIELNKDL